MPKENDTRKEWISLINETESVYNKARIKLQLSDSANDILYAIYEFGEGCTQADICKMSWASRQTVNSSIRKLEKDGILTLSHIDGKKKAIYLTDKGKALMQISVTSLVSAENAALSTLTEAEQDELIRLTRKYLDGLNTQVSLLHD